MTDHQDKSAEGLSSELVALRIRNVESIATLLHVTEEPETEGDTLLHPGLYYLLTCNSNYVGENPVDRREIRKRLLEDGTDDGLGFGSLLRARCDAHIAWSDETRGIKLTVRGKLFDVTLGSDDAFGYGFALREMTFPDEAVRRNNAVTLRSVFMDVGFREDSKIVKDIERLFIMARLSYPLSFTALMHELGQREWRNWAADLRGVGIKFKIVEFARDSDRETPYILLQFASGDNYEVILEDIEDLFKGMRVIRNESNMVLPIP